MGINSTINKEGKENIYLFRYLYSATKSGSNGDYVRVSLGGLQVDDNKCYSFPLLFPTAPSPIPTSPQLSIY